jgi:alpha-glucosidase
MIGFLLLLAASGARAQADLVRVASLDGQIEFRLLIAQPPKPALLYRLAYQVSFRGKPLLDTSFLGIKILNQDPILGENVGLVSSQTASVEKTYNSLVAEYLQNGSLGRRIEVEVRVYDDGVAFRYGVPRSVPLDEILIEDEATQFQFANDVKTDRGMLSEIPGDALIPVPLIVGQFAIAEAPAEDYPRLYLRHPGGRMLIATLPARPDDPQLAYHGRTPIRSSWRVLMLTGSNILRMLE